MMSLVIMLALSSYAQCLFGLDGPGGLTRYRLLPLRSWQILLAKDAAFLIVALALTLPLNPLAGLAAALTVLAIGHEQAVGNFQTASPLAILHRHVARKRGVAQVAAMFMAAYGTTRTSVLLILPIVGIYALSVWWFSRKLN